MDNENYDSKEKAGVTYGSEDLEASKSNIVGEADEYTTATTVHRGLKSRQ